MEAVGEGVAGLKVGDAVSTIPAFSQNEYGVYGDMAIVPAAAVVKHPSSLSWIEAAAIWMQYATAYGALIEIAKLKAGDTVLIPAASSSVGIAAIQLANMVGATPVALTRTSQQARPLAGTRCETRHRHRGARPGRRSQCSSRPGKGHAWCSIPSAGRRSRSWLSAMADVRHSVSLRGAEHGADSAAAVRSAGQDAHDSRLHAVWSSPPIRGSSRRLKKYIVDGLAAGKLKPVIAKTFTLDQIVEAHRYLESNQQIGKIVVTV